MSASGILRLREGGRREKKRGEGGREERGRWGEGGNKTWVTRNWTINCTPSPLLFWQVIVLLAVPVMHEATPTPTALGDGSCSIHVLVFHSIVSVHWTGCMCTPETVDLGGEEGEGREGRGGEGGEEREGREGGEGGREGREGGKGGEGRGGEGREGKTKTKRREERLGKREQSGANVTISTHTGYGIINICASAAVFVGI